ncbi:hypothetical protein E2C01_043161 [Portunus trituberculatus]|uniref:Uncharacterized protein n=1 Tax=Portunus trituberculatus TaxID=210409 RepID=A0A5B7FS69_PORTR|nr:hypothetical protein [Portunus trituberculatus]
MAVYGNPDWPRNVHISLRCEAQGSDRPGAEATDDAAPRPTHTTDASTTTTNTNINNSSNNNNNRVRE